MTVSIAGAGPAGAAAALAALAHGAEVRLYEKSAFPRHKVCGEFLSPEVVALLGELGARERFFRAEPAPIVQVALRVGRAEKHWRLDPPAYGLSRYRFDELLLACAIERGARLERRLAADGALPRPLVWAVGRTSSAPRGGRLFGFKAHFTGPSTSAVELFFFRGGYVGVNPVEGGVTNVCGLCEERQLPPDAIVARVPALCRRLEGMRQVFPWLHTGPLIFAQQRAGDRYLAGDALSFVDPFTGTGMLSALISGQSAGRCGALGRPVQEHLRFCQERLGRAFRASSFFRKVLASGWAEALLPLAPSGLLFHATRPK